MTAPAPIYPAGLPSGDWVGGCVNGKLVLFTLVRMPGHRVDQWAAWHNGQVVAQAAGLVALHQMLRDLWPKAPSLRGLASLQHGYTERDDADCAALGL
jgi:hypothetical protein